MAAFPRYAYRQCPGRGKVGARPEDDTAIFVSSSSPSPPPQQAAPPWPRGGEGETAGRESERALGHAVGAAGDCWEVQCTSCGQAFRDARSYEAHYNAVHLYQCESCEKSFGSARLLEIHIEERHDSFFAARRAKLAREGGGGEASSDGGVGAGRREGLFRCLAEGCEERFWSPGLRWAHLVRCHAFPENFYIPGIEERKSRRGNEKKREGGDSRGLRGESADDGAPADAVATATMAVDDGAGCGGGAGGEESRASKHHHRCKAKAKARGDPKGKAGWRDGGHGGHGGGGDDAMDVDALTASFAKKVDLLPLGYGATKTSKRNKPKTRLAL